MEYGEYVDALQRDRVGNASETDRLTLSHARSRGVQTPGGIGRPDYRGMLQMQAADVLAFQPVGLTPVDYQGYIDALQRHRAGAQMEYDECTLSHAVSRGVTTPGGICRPDSRGMLHLIAAPQVVWNADARKVAVGFDSATRDVVRTRAPSQSASSRVDGWAISWCRPSPEAEYYLEVAGALRQYEFACNDRFPT